MKFKMTSTIFGINSASAGLPVNRAEIDQTNKKIVEFAGPLKITGIKKGHEIKPRDFVMITGQPCQVKSIRFLSPTGKLVITGEATTPLPKEAELRKQRANPTFATEVDALDEIRIPEVKFIFISQFRIGDYLPINDRPCKIIDFNISKCACHSGDKVHVIGADIFTGKQMEALVSHHVLISRLEVKWERKELLNISDDLMCSLIGDDNTVEENVEVPDQVLGKAIQNFWADGERNVMLMTAEVMGIKGVVSAYEVVEIELLGICGTGLLKLINLATGATVDVPHPVGGMGEEIERLLEEVEKGRSEVMEVNIRMPHKILYPSESTTPEIWIVRQIRDTYLGEDVLSRIWTLVD